VILSNRGRILGKFWENFFGSLEEWENFWQAVANKKKQALFFTPPCPLKDPSPPDIITQNFVAVNG